VTSNQAGSTAFFTLLGTFIRAVLCRLWAERSVKAQHSRRTSIMSRHRRSWCLHREHAKQTVMLNAAIMAHRDQPNHTAFVLNMAIT
jgi:hypothetical protein